MATLPKLMRHFSKKRIAALGALIVLVLVQLLASPAQQAHAAYATTITNFDTAGNQVIRFDTAGNAVDAHDGDLAFFGGNYYLYGTSYDCGYRWQVDGAPFCGFKSYSSPDLVHWTDRGLLFDPSSWQSRCNGNTYGCYRPHVAYHANSGTYVMWVNSYDNVSGFHVFTSSTPAGPFTQSADPALGVNNGPPVGGLKNGDHDVFVDDNGAAYLAYTDWVTGGGIVVEKLNSNYQSGTGEYARVTARATEAPAMFKRNGTYYMTFSDPNCGYCTTGTSYSTAPTALGPWSAATKISTNSCGGQPSFVAPISTTAGTVYLYGSDLWNNGAKNEALANFYWGPLTFNGDAINPLACQNQFALTLSAGSAGTTRPVTDLDQHAGTTNFRFWSDIGPLTRIQTFVPSRTGKLTSASLTTFQIDEPTAGLTLEIVTADAGYTPTGPALYTVTIPTASIGWSPQNVTINPNISVTAGVRYGIVARSTTTSGSYGWVFNDNAPYPSGGSAYKTSGPWTAETNRTLKFQTTVSGSSWTMCAAAENGTCAVAGTQVVRYGAGTSYLYRTVTGSIPCNQTAFGGDPAFGIVKHCDYSPDGWTSCAAAENGTCAVAGTQVVRYGAGTSYLYRTVTGSIPCNQTAFGGDPAFGIVKHCDYSPQAPNSGWTTCATGETGACAFTGRRTVAYGTNGRYIYRTASGSIACNSTSFGGDPVFGTVKSCHYR